MKDITIGAFCEQNGACSNGREWAYAQLPGKSKAMMYDLWPLLGIDQYNWLLWIFSRPNILDKKQQVKHLCHIVRNTPLENGLTVWSLLTDQRSINAM